MRPTYFVVAIPKDPHAGCLFLTEDATWAKDLRGAKQFEDAEKAYTRAKHARHDASYIARPTRGSFGGGTYKMPPLQGRSHDVWNVQRMKARTVEALLLQGGNLREQKLHELEARS